MTNYSFIEASEIRPGMTIVEDDYSRRKGQVMDARVIASSHSHYMTSVHCESVKYAIEKWFAYASDEIIKVKV